MSRMLTGFVAALAGLGLAGAACAAATNETVITSDRLTFEYQRAMAVFEGNVIVSDPQIRIETDQLRVFFDAANNVKAVTALGNVRLRQGDRSGACHKAVYVASMGEIVMSGRAELRRGRDVVSGDQIVLNLVDDRMSCVPGRLVFTAEGLSDEDARSKVWSQDFKKALAP